GRARDQSQVLPDVRVRVDSLTDEGSNDRGRDARPVPTGRRVSMGRDYLGWGRDLGRRLNHPSILEKQRAADGCGWGGLSPNYGAAGYKGNHGEYETNPAHA